MTTPRDPDLLNRTRPGGPVETYEDHGAGTLSNMGVTLLVLLGVLALVAVILAIVAAT